MADQKKIVIELEPWEAEKLNAGVKYLFEAHLKDPVNVASIPPDVVNSVSYLIAWRSITFNDQNG